MLLKLGLASEFMQDSRLWCCPYLTPDVLSSTLRCPNLRESQWPPKMIKLGMSGVPRTKSSEKHERLSEN